VGDVLRRERLAQERTLRDVADTARISMPYLSEIERGRKEASSEVLAAAARALGLGLADLLALAQGELARLLRPGPARAPAQVIARPGPAPGSADVTGDGRDAVPPAGTGPAGALLPAEAVPPPKPVPPAEAVQPETAPSAGALSPETAPAAGALPGETAPAAGALPPEGTTPAGILSTGRTGPRVIPQPQMSLAA
jgi:hypothetical protein